MLATARGAPAGRWGRTVPLLPLSSRPRPPLWLQRPSASPGPPSPFASEPLRLGRSAGGVLAPPRALFPARTRYFDASCSRDAWGRGLAGARRPRTFLRFLLTSPRGWMGCDLSICRSETHAQSPSRAEGRACGGRPAGRERTRPGQGSELGPFPRPRGHWKPVLRFLRWAVRQSRTPFCRCRLLPAARRDAGRRGRTFRT